MKVSKHPVADSCKLDPAQISLVQKLAADLFSVNTSRREEHISLIASRAGASIFTQAQRDDLYDSLVVFFEAAFDKILETKALKETELCRFLVVLNHLPVLEGSPYYDEALKELTKYYQKDKGSIKLFDKLQLVHLYTEIGHLKAAKDTIAELESKISPDQLSFYTFLQISKSRIYESEEDKVTQMRLLLELMLRIWDKEGPDATLSLMISWLSSIHWLRHREPNRLLLSNLYERIKKPQNLNAALLALSLFLMDDKLLSPPEKMRYCQDLIENQDRILNTKQLHTLYFFAGNYLSGLKEQFQDSIKNYKASNYYLHKCWERLIKISGYLRSHSRSPHYKPGMRLLEKRFIELSNQTSLRNSSFVENLQANFCKIEELYREVGELSLTDALTGHRNRRFMDQNLPQIVALASRNNAPVSFIMVDVDNFKDINDIYGHPAGDYILRKVGVILRSEFRQSDIVIRYGGDEFLLVLFNSSGERCKEIMEDLRKKIEETIFRYKKKDMRISVSIGIASEKFSSKAGLKDLNEFIQRADTALYQAKEAGRNTIRVY